MLFDQYLIYFDVVEEKGDTSFETQWVHSQTGAELESHILGSDSYSFQQTKVLMDGSLEFIETQFSLLMHLLKRITSIF